MNTIREKMDEAARKAKERIAIAKDALEWVQAGALIPKCGTYVRPEFYPYNVAHDKQLRDVVLGKCKTCVRGALFLAKAVRYDNVIVSNFDGRYANQSALEDHFETDQIYLIENYYEGRTIHWVDTDSTNYFTFCHLHPDPSERMTLILQNIIDNNGTFVPEELPRT
jgi:hypothetical protein